MFRVDWPAIKRGFFLTAIPILAILVYFSYNYARFGSPTDTGYNYIFPDEFLAPGETRTFIEQRVSDLGILAKSRSGACHFIKWKSLSPF